MNLKHIMTADDTLDILMYQLEIDLFDQLAKDKMKMYLWMN